MRGSAADLPFGSYFAELAIAGLAAHASKAGQENAMKLEEQFIGSPCLEAAYWPLPNDRCWGEDTRLIEAWFDEGEELEFSERDLLIDEPDRWERALHWVRSLAVATGIIPA